MTETVTPAEVRKLWVAEMKSGKYRHGTGYLKHDGYGCRGTCHCGLGVLCELAVRHGITDDPKICSDGAYSFTGNRCCLPESVRSWAGLTESGTFININDSSDSYAPVIALIENPPKGLFRE